ncbi:MAG: hypothetical protein A2Y15_00355 [Clostridiales bacterium GWF2_36_10]|nr:MAG: hypothetical protein A2Y15_00355 [Clostridiales bacterium GWF2_36_10]HAN21759.1 chromosome partitioning protein ParB [Clostridiales bacterium]
MHISFGDKQIQCGQYKRKDRIIMLSVSDIAPNPLQPRKKFDEEEITFLAESIKQFGVIQPIAVKLREDAPCLRLNNEKLYASTYEIIAGERRWRAARRLGMKRIPCILFETDKSGSAMLALVENIQRKELGMFEEAAALQNILLMTDMTQNDLAKKLSISQSNISNKLRLLKLTSEERSLVVDTSLTERHARALIRIDSEHTRLILLNRIIEKNLSASDAEKLVDEYIKGDFVKEKINHKVTRICAIKDIRFFFNTIDRAVSLLGDAGINAKSEKVEYDEYLEVIIKVAKQKKS